MKLIPNELLLDSLEQAGVEATVELSDYMVKLDAIRYSKVVIVKFKSIEDLHLYKLAGYFVETDRLVFEVEDGE